MIIYTTSSKNLVSQLVKIRKKYKVSQSQLAKVAKCDVATISRWERGVMTPSVSILISVIKELSSKIEWWLLLSIKSNNDKTPDSPDIE